MLLTTEGSTPAQTSETSQAGDWKTAGTGVVSLVQTPNTATSYLGLDDRATVKQSEAFGNFLLRLLIKFVT